MSTEELSESRLGLLRPVRLSLARQLFEFTGKVLGIEEKRGFAIFY